MDDIENEDTIKQGQNDINKGSATNELIVSQRNDKIITACKDTVTIIAGTASIINPTAAANTGLGLLSIATISSVNSFAKKASTRKKLAVCILAANAVIATIGMNEILGEIRISQRE